MSAHARIERRWPDQSVCITEVGCDSSYPDAIAEILAAVVRLDQAASPGDDE